MNEVFDDNGKLVDERYNKIVVRFLDEFEWYIEELRNERKMELYIPMRVASSVSCYCVYTTGTLKSHED